MSKHLDIVFRRRRDRAGPDELLFVETEDADQKSIRFGSWIRRPDGYTVLRFSAADVLEQVGHPAEVDDAVYEMDAETAELEAEAHEQAEEALALAEHAGPESYGVTRGGLSPNDIERLRGELRAALLANPDVFHFYAANVAEVLQGFGEFADHGDRDRAAVEAMNLIFGIPSFPGVPRSGSTPAPKGGSE